MNAYKKAVLSALVLAVGTGCGDPFNAEPGGTPTVVGANVSFDTNVFFGTTAYEGVKSGPAWTIAGVPSSCVAGVPVAPSPVIFLRFNKLLDGFSVQTSPTDCTPAGNWLTVTPAAPSGQTWYACYMPSSPTPDWSASVVLFRAPSPAVGPPVVLPASGWNQAGSIEASTTAVTTYRATGRVFDKSRNPADIDVTLALDPVTPCP